MTTHRWEILAASAIAISALALAIAHPFSPPTAPVDAQVVPDPDPPSKSEVRPQVEVIFAIDTTGSMGGLIDGAKEKVWSIANALASGQPRPDLRVGLVAYRDLGDAYVVRSTPLARDLDDVYAALMALDADGGGDGPEHVNAALAEAIRSTQWSSGENVLRVIFLVGDAPPHDDYDDGLDSSELAREARAKGIHLNTVRCGSDSTTEHAWRSLASIGGGEFTSIAQDGGVVDIVTPYDEELRALNAAMAGTVLAYGSAEDKVRSQAKMATRRAMKASRAASAASFSAKSGTLNREDLVTALDDGVELEALPQDALPTELQGLGRAEQRAVVNAKKAARKGAEARILEVAKKRDAYLKEKSPKTSAGFDEQVVEMVRKQTSSIGVKY